MQEFIQYTVDSMKLLVTLFSNIKVSDISFGLMSLGIGIIGIVSYRILRG